MENRSSTSSTPAPAPAFAEQGPVQRGEAFACRRAILLSLLGLGSVLGAIALAYTRALDADFQFDDVDAVLGRAALKDVGSFLRETFLAELLQGGRALTDLTFAIDHALAGWDAQQFHATNVTLHLAVVAVVFAFTRQLLRRAGSVRPDLWALAAAGIWGLHPLQTEAVTYVCQRAEVLGSVFAVTSLWLLVAAEDRAGSGRGALAYAAAFSTFLLAVAAKPNAAVVPVLYLLHAACFPPRVAVRAWRNVALRSLPFFALLVAGAAKLLSSFAHRVDVGFDIPRITAGRYALTQFRVIVSYLRLLLWPSGQNFDWQVRLSTGLDATTAAAGLFLLALLVGAVHLVRRARTVPPEEARAMRLVAFGIGWFFVVLGPTSTLVPLADLMVEHRVYLASWGIVLAFTAGVQGIVERSRGRVTALVATTSAFAILVALGLATHARNAVWRTRETLWSDAVAKSASKPRPHNNLGEALWRRGAVEASLAEFRTALALDDGSMLAVERARAYQNMSAALGALRRYDESIAAGMEGLKLQPSEPKLLTNIIESYRAAGDLDGARRYAARLVEVQPRKMAVHNSYGQLLMAVGDVTSALREFATAASLDVGAFEPAVNCALAYEKLGDAGKACAWWSRVSELAPRPELRTAAVARRRELACTER